MGGFLIFIKISYPMKNKEKKYFWKGIKHQISLCCILFFITEWQSIKQNIHEYGDKMSELTNNEGVILCPDCLICHNFN